MSQITLIDKQELVMQSFVKSINPTTECEIRFGSFTKSFGPSRDEDKAKFISNVEIDFFYRLKQLYNNTYGISKKITYTKDIQYENAKDKKGKIRKTITTNSNFEPTQEQPIFMLKNNHRNFNFYTYGFRASLSTEKMLPRIDGVDLSKPTFFRFKDRTSYDFPYGRLDMTIVYQGNTEEEAISRNDTRYEIEFEIKAGVDYNDVMKIVTDILTVRQDNFYIISDNERKEIFNEYKRLTNYSYFIGAQPETLQKEQLTLLFKELYSVTDKADGERYFMLIDSNGFVYFIDSNINEMVKTNIRSTTFKSCLLDGELIRQKNNHKLNHISFYAFDIIYFDGQDLRGNLQFLLKQRLEKVREVMSSLDNNDKYSFHMKKFIYRNVFMGSDIIMKHIHDKPYENDGLIFTPMNEAYPTSKKWTKLLKWKPEELNTIDFYSVKESNNKWSLYVQHVQHKTQGKTYRPKTQQELLAEKRSELVKFDVNRLCENTETTHITFETTFDDNLFDPTTDEPFKTNTVIEFKWNGKKFVPLRTRWDKTYNPNKQGNYSSVACSIWNNINNPITSAQLFQMTNTTTEQVSDNFFFERMNDFHSKINQYLINKYTNKNDLTTANCDKFILELNTFNMIKNPNTFTFCNSIKQTNISYKNFKVDLLSDTACKIISNSVKNLCKTVFCLKFNTFLQSQNALDNIIKTIDYNIQKNGQLVISFIDSMQVEKLTTNFKESIHDNQIMYFIHNKNTSITPFNKTIKLFINGVSNENEPVEYIVDFDFLLQYMESKGYKCIETDLYSNMYNSYKNQTPNKLSTYEEDISGLYRICVFEKIESNISAVLNNKEELNMFNKNHLIEHKDIQFHKIKTTYDIYNILNCLKYNVFKSKYQNLELKSLHDIKLCIDELASPSLNITYYQKGDLIDNNNYIYFYNTLFEEETEGEEGTEIISVEQFYIILLNHKIIQTKQSIETINQLLESNQQPSSIYTPSPSIDTPSPSIDTPSQNSRKEELITELKKLGNKITVVLLKEYLKECGLKTSGKKDELLQRLNEHLNKN